MIFCSFSKTWDREIEQSELAHLNLKTFLEDNEEDSLLEDKTFKKIKQNDKKAINKASNNNKPKIIRYILYEEKLIIQFLLI